eukprot:10227638-Lingulodinium_polyedra.AAC.1
MTVDFSAISSPRSLQPRTKIAPAPTRACTAHLRVPSTRWVTSSTQAPVETEGAAATERSSTL